MVDVQVAELPWPPPVQQSVFFFVVELGLTPGWSDVVEPVAPVVVPAEGGPEESWP